MKILVFACLAALTLSCSAHACIGGPTNITGGQIDAVVKAVKSDYSVQFAGIKALTISEDEITVTLYSRVDGESTRVYRTKPAQDSGPGNCYKMEAERIK